MKANLSRNVQLIYANQNFRPATWLAELEDGRNLFEYEMPGGSSALRTIRDCETCHGTGRKDGRECKRLGCYDGYLELRTISYSTLPRYWIAAIVAAGNQNELIFEPQIQRQTSKQLQAAVERFKRIMAEVEQENEWIEETQESAGDWSGLIEFVEKWTGPDVLEIEASAPEIPDITIAGVEVEDDNRTYEEIFHK